ncbi:hypothetical protein VTN77DRAFT_9288 [Rasamsonia byssochlamydoides]|uniref:uncharacterized protein n=1 Tax=Rasamsonia byssochlamydoides TaxID=89139 RepID=UPI003744427B
MHLTGNAKRSTEILKPAPSSKRLKSDPACFIKETLVEFDPSLYPTSPELTSGLPQVYTNPQPLHWNREAVIETKMAIPEQESVKVPSLEHVEHAPDRVNDAAQVSGVRSVALAEVLAQENPRPFRKSFLKLYLCLAVAYMCSTTNGFDANTFEHDFATYFDLTPANNGAVVALYVVGQICGCFFAGPLADWYGRRFGMAFGSLICIIGAVVQASARTRHDLMAGRFILGIGAVIANASAFFFCGTIATSWLEFGLSCLPNNSVLAWRLPLAVQAVPSLILLACVYFMPETPRWWMAQDRPDKAKEILVQYHGDGNPDSAIVQLEMEEMQQVVSITGSDKRFWDFRDLFNSPGARYRTLLAICVAWFSEIELPPTSYYLPLMVKTVGITSIKTQLLLNALQTPIMMVASLSGLCLIDHFGRRQLLITGSILMSVSLSIITACTAQHGGKPVVSGVGITFLYIFLVVFAFCWVPSQSLYPSEVLAFNARGKCLAFYNLTRNIVLVINTYVPPIAIANVSWRFYLFYILFDAFGAFVVHLIFVETRGWNFEEIEGIFQSPSPRKESLKSRKMVFSSVDVEQVPGMMSD